MDNERGKPDTDAVEVVFGSGDSSGSSQTSEQCCS